MINFYSETEFNLINETKISKWIIETILSEKFKEGEITFIFCDDIYLHKLNVEFLNHDTLTDIISFDNSIGKQINGEIYISIDRVLENTTTFQTTFEDELHRVIIHGILHFCGYKDKKEEDINRMRKKEDEALKTRNFI